jgi:CRISPR-associated endonuclease/helicase Cas3
MNQTLNTWVESLGTAGADVPVVSSPQEWMELARGRSEWWLWGKATPTSVCPAHPLLCHMLDVTAVAARMLSSQQPVALRERLLAVAPDELAALQMLLFVIALHDLGKATPAFQGKVDWAKRELQSRDFDFNLRPKDRHHGDIGMVFLTPVLEKRGAAPEVACALARAVTAHHGQFPLESSQISRPREEGRKPPWGTAREAIVESLAQFFGLEQLHPAATVDHSYVMLLAGLTSVADWVGSMAEVFVYEPPQVSLACYWSKALERADRALMVAGFRAPSMFGSRSFGELFPEYEPWPLHLAADELARALKEPTLFVIEAPMGEGKTEAALTLAEAAAGVGLYIGLPTQATANQMFGRIEEFLRRTRPGAPSTLLLAHSEATLVDRFRKLTLASVFDRDAHGSVRAEAWFLSKKRALLAEYAVGTIDQALLSVMLVPHAFVRHFGLAGKVVLLDEVHAYDTYTGTLLDRLLEWLAASGTTVILLSATLPSVRRADLVRAYRRGAKWPEEKEAHQPYPRITVAGRVSTRVCSFVPRSKAMEVSLFRVSDNIEALAAQVVECVRAGGCVGWVCNTIARAQAATIRVRELAPELERLLLHARMLPEARAEREAQVARWLGPEKRAAHRPERCLVIGTQVLEQSLDLDFDLLITDLAPMDLVLQRAGRLWRHRRSNRSAAHPRPQLLVAYPAGGWEQAPLVEPALIYREDLLRNTLRLLEGRSTLLLPDEIEALVENVYAGASPSEHITEETHERLQAEQRLMPPPYVVDSPFGSLQVFLQEDDDPELHQKLRAATRLGRPTVEIVCVERRGSHLVVGGGNDTRIEPDVTPDRTLTGHLVRRSIGVSTPSVVADLVDKPAPKGWARSALLRYRRLVPFENGCAWIGSTRLTLDAELGLRIEKP